VEDLIGYDMIINFDFSANYIDAFSLHANTMTDTSRSIVQSKVVEDKAFF